MNFLNTEYRKKWGSCSKILSSLMAWLAWVQLNSVSPFSPSLAMSESRIFEQEYHLSRYMFKLFILKPGNGGGGRGLKMNGFFMLFLEDSSPSPTTVRKPFHYYQN